MAAIAGVIRTSCLRLSSRQIEEMTQYQLQTQLLEFTNQQTWASCCLFASSLFVCLFGGLFVCFCICICMKASCFSSLGIMGRLLEWDFVLLQCSMPVSRHAEWRVADRTNLVFTNTIAANTNSQSGNRNYWIAVRCCCISGPDTAFLRKWPNNCRQQGGA